MFICGSGHGGLVLVSGFGEAVQFEAVGMLIGKVAIAAPVARPIEIEFERAADIADDQERRPRMIAGQVYRIAFGLRQGIAHELVVSRAGRRSGGGFGDIEELGLPAVGFGQFRLLGFQNEAAALVEVDGPGVAANAAAGDRAFELIAAEHAAFGHFGHGQIKRTAHIVDELGIVGAFGPAFYPQPFGDERGYFHAM